jgi:hypothetical protein
VNAYGGFDEGRNTVVNQSLRLLLHGVAAAAVGGAVSALGEIISSPAQVRLDDASLRHYASTALAGAIIAVLAYFRRSPLSAG